VRHPRVEEVDVAFSFPVNLDVTGRPCVVVGSGPAAGEKAEALADAGADVRVIAERPGARLRALEDAGHVRIQRRRYRRGDLEGVFLAVASGEDPVDNADLRREADFRRVLLNAMDDIPNCHFAFPAIVRSGDLRVTVSTAGRAPAVAKRFRERLEAEIGPAYGELVDVAAEARERALPREVPFAEWSRRWTAALADLDGLLDLVASGRHAEARDRILAQLAPAAAPARAAS
jgi:precorrin-2 dehydrogenase/sirohydrochlorin ferrochelatase